MKNRRRYIRHDLAYEVVFTTSDKPDNKIHTKSFDISIGGIGIKLKEFISGSGKLNIEIHDPHIEKSLNAKGKLVWQGYHSNSGEKCAGVQFTKIDINEIKTLLERSAKLG